jgi:hypothetical protein
MVGEAVEERAGEPFGAEHGRPLVERQIARNQGAASLIALAEDLEQQFGPSRRERHIAEFIDVKSRATLTPPQKPGSTLILLRIVKIFRVEFRVQPCPSQLRIFLRYQWYPRILRGVTIGRDFTLCASRIEPAARFR